MREKEAKQIDALIYEFVFTHIAYVISYCFLFIVNQAQDTQQHLHAKVPTSENCVYVIYGGKTVRVLEMSLSYDE